MDRDHEKRVDDERDELTSTPDKALRVVLYQCGFDHDATISLNCPDLPTYRAIAAIYSAAVRGNKAGLAAGVEALVESLEASLEKLAQKRAA